MSNKKAGNDFEQEFCKMLSNAGFWAHNMANRKNGQPADVIAAKDGLAYLFDCKDCANDVFQLSRIEDNQKAAMEKWNKCGNYDAMFALSTSAGVYIIPCTIMSMINKKSLNLDDIAYNGVRLDVWLGILEGKYEY